MSPTNTPTSKTELVDKDMAEQARPGHGIPSQDPEAAAQSPLNPDEAEREANSVLAGGGVIVGAATGAAIGTLVAGPVGAVVAGTVGAVAGALGGVAAGPLVNQDEPDAADKARKTALKP
ncbi:hypothetical protein [Hydrogenophaga sp.]|uniref:hypothetical protein n=1 Tax=Hydrogenophaga sp. TaxID=1904254 RepID=UPI0027199C3D|nr:hypothetical protein [Hydrogenophaga sp.]MDO9134572.1 hypothetical protein [Hydrogenophaga sp.]MDP2076384.1 hypothetical protein [Hydrogenophaga sp.]MDP3109642.1 hypothetical protein [Hydrogenophaga sp.]